MTFDIVITTRPSARHNLPTEFIIQTEAFRSFARKREMEILPRRIRGMKKKGETILQRRKIYVEEG